MKDNTLRMEVTAIRKLLSDLTIKVDALRKELALNGCIHSQYYPVTQVNIPKLRFELTQLEEYLDLEAVDVPSHTSIQVKTTQGQS